MKTENRAPVLILGFNRPRLLSRVISKVIGWSPPAIYVSIDGPPIGDERVLRAVYRCQSLVRDFAEMHPMIVRFESENLGCKDGVVAGINWFFENEENGIILEDDCDPDNSFYSYCSWLLAELSDNPNAISISGHRPMRRTNPKMETVQSRYPQIWGWGTWRRVWQKYDKSINSWPALRKTDWLVETVGLSSTAAKFWTQRFDQVHSGELDTWDYQFTFQSFLTNSFSTIPPVNLVKNTGFDRNATHTRFRAWIESNSWRGTVGPPYQVNTGGLDNKMDAWLERWAYKTWRSVAFNSIRSGHRHGLIT
jgi:hypothetical protein